MFVVSVLQTASTLAPGDKFQSRQQQQQHLHQQHHHHEPIQEHNNISEQNQHPQEGSSEEPYLTFHHHTPHRASSTSLGTGSGSGSGSGTGSGNGNEVSTPATGPEHERQQQQQQLQQQVFIVDQNEILYNSNNKKQEKENHFHHHHPHSHFKKNQQNQNQNPNQLVGHHYPPTRLPTPQSPSPYHYPDHFTNGHGTVIGNGQLYPYPLSLSVKPIKLPHSRSLTQLTHLNNHYNSNLRQNYNYNYNYDHQLSNGNVNGVGQPFKNGSIISLINQSQNYKDILTSRQAQQQQHFQHHPHHQHLPQDVLNTEGMSRNKAGVSSLPGRYSGTNLGTTTGTGTGPGSGSGSGGPNNTNRGFAETFVSANMATPPTNIPHTSSTNTNGEGGLSAKDKDKEHINNKKWTFGGLFKRKPKTANSVSSPPPPATSSSSIRSEHGTRVPPSSLPAHLTRSTSSKSYLNPNPIPKPARANRMEFSSDLSSSDYAEDEILPADRLELKNNSKDNSSKDAAKDSKQTSNFLVRRLSKRKEKKDKDKKMAGTAESGSPSHNTNSQSQSQSQTQNPHNSDQNGFLKVPQLQRANGRRVGSSPESLAGPNGSQSQNQNGGGGPWTPWQGWEATKKSASNPSNNILPNYSSSGSLSLSMEGGGHSSGGNSRSSRAALREAVKARAVARRESFFNESSSSDGEGEGGGEDGVGGSNVSLQGSFSSLGSSRNRRLPHYQSPKPKSTHPSSQSPSLQRPELVRVSPSLQGSGFRPQAPPSPRWEARIVYQQETLEQEDPVVIRLPRKSRKSTPQQEPQQQQLLNESEIEIINAGLQVPLVLPNNSMSPYPPDDRTYANLPEPPPVPTSSVEKSAPPPPPRDFNIRGGQGSNFYRPVSCSYLDSYPHYYQQQQQQPSPLPFHQPQLSQPPNQIIMRPNPIQNHPKFSQNLPDSGVGGVTGEYDNLTIRNNSRNGFAQISLPNYEDELEIEKSDTFPGRHFNNFSGRDNIGLGNVSSSVSMSAVVPDSSSFVRSPSEPPEMVSNSKVNRLQVHVQPRNAITPSITSQKQKPFNSSTPTAAQSQSQNNKIKVESNRSSNYNQQLKETQSQKQLEKSPQKKLSSQQQRPGQPVIMSKLGFPVRKLAEANKLPATQSPVHMRASEFWRKKEQEVTGVLSSGHSHSHSNSHSTSNSNSGNASASNNMSPSQKRFLSRIRSADSSPVPMPRSNGSNNLNSLNAGPTTGAAGAGSVPGMGIGTTGVAQRFSPNPNPNNRSQNSNESISSLSSFSADNAPSPQQFLQQQQQHQQSKGSSSSPSGASQKLIQSGPLRPQTLNLKSPGFVLNRDRERNSSSSENQVQAGQQQQQQQQQPRPPTPQGSACERLKVRMPPPASPLTVLSSPSPPPRPPSSSGGPGGEPVIKNILINGNGKTPGKNLEDALNELEDMYKSLRLSDEDLLDRAERRDLPTPHQELRNAPMIPYRFSPPGLGFGGSFESLDSSGTNTLGGLGGIGNLAGTGTGTGTGSSGGGSTYFGSESNISGISRTPRQRAPPLRRSSRPDTVADDMAKRKYDLNDVKVKSNDPRDIVGKAGSYMVMSPAFSPPSSPIPPSSGMTTSSSFGDHMTFSFPLSPHDPDLTLDDVTFRNYKRANAIKIIDPQPLFGIPLGPSGPAPASDYLHAQPEEKYRPIFRHVKRPDIVKDDIAFRNLRKDLSADTNSTSKDWTPRLFQSVSFDPTVASIHNSTSSSGSGSGAGSKKLRAIRSLSANISHLIPFKESNVFSEIGKWNSFTDIPTRALSPRPYSTYMEPSWVEQIEKLQENADPSSVKTAALSKSCSSRAVPKCMSPNPNSIGSTHYPDGKPRRPWTDILLESFEKEKEEIERLNAAADAAIAEQEEQLQKQKQQLEQQLLLSHSSALDEDDEVFLDAQPDIVILTNFNSGGGEKLPLSPGSVTPRLSTSPPTQDTPRPQEKPQPKARQLPKEEPANRDRDRDTGNSASSTGLFTPLPPPRKVLQIHLDSFNGSGPGLSQVDEIDEHPQDEGEEPEREKTELQELPGKYDEEDLNHLIDALVRDADNCGPEKASPKSTRSSSRSTDAPDSRSEQLSHGHNENVRLVHAKLVDSADAEGAKVKSKSKTTTSESQGHGHGHGQASLTSTLKSASSVAVDKTSCSSSSSASSSSTTTTTTTCMVDGGGVVKSKPISKSILKKEAEDTEDSGSSKGKGNKGKSVFHIKQPWGGPKEKENDDVTSPSSSTSPPTKTKTVQKPTKVTKTKEPSKIKTTTTTTTTTAPTTISNSNESPAPSRTTTPTTTIKTQDSVNLETSPVITNGVKMRKKQENSSQEDSESKKEKDKSYKRKSNLNRGLAEEAVPPSEYSSLDENPAIRRRSRASSVRPVSQECSSSGIEETLPVFSPKEKEKEKEPDIQNSNLNSSHSIIKLPQIPTILQSVENKYMKAPLNIPASTAAKTNKIVVVGGTNSVVHLTPVGKSAESSKNGDKSKRDPFASDTEGMTSIKRLLQKEKEKDERNSNATPTKPFVFPNAPTSTTSSSINRQKENATTNSNSNFTGLKKSPSAGSTFNWSSKIGNSQPSFLRKFFENNNNISNNNNNNNNINEKDKISNLNSNLSPAKTLKTPSLTPVKEKVSKKISENAVSAPKKPAVLAENENENGIEIPIRRVFKTEEVISVSAIPEAENNDNVKTDEPPPKEDPVLAFSVAEKASFFMKLEHNQRFSRWRKPPDSAPNPDADQSENVPPPGTGANTVLSTEVQVNVDYPPKTQGHEGSNINSSTRSKPRFSTQPVRLEDVEMAKDALRTNQYFQENSSEIIPIKPAEVLPPLPLGGMSWNSQYKPSYTNRDETSRCKTALGSMSDSRCASAFGKNSTNSLPMDIDPSKLSLKERMGIFDRIRLQSQSQNFTSQLPPPPQSPFEMSHNHHQNNSQVRSRPPSSNSNKFMKKTFGFSNSNFPGSYPPPGTIGMGMGFPVPVPAPHPNYQQYQYQSRGGSVCPTPVRTFTASNSRCGSSLFEPRRSGSVFEEFSTPIGWFGNSVCDTTSYSNIQSQLSRIEDGDQSQSDRELCFSPLSADKRRGSLSDVELNTLRQQHHQHQQQCQVHGGGGGYNQYPQQHQQHQQQHLQFPGDLSGHVNGFNTVGVNPYYRNQNQNQNQSRNRTPVRNYRVKSMILASGGSDAETHSEDGEVSSGGQEVAEIISKSYENSPVVRKKTWKHQSQHAKNPGQHPQPNLAKEIWRKCVHHDEFTDFDGNEVFYDAASEFEDFKAEIPPATVPPPATSNLLHILTALSSSNDELDDGGAKPGNNPKYISNNNSGASVGLGDGEQSKAPSRTSKIKTFRKSLIESHTTNNSNPNFASDQSRTAETIVSVPHPDDESFRTFFKNNRLNFPPVYPSTGTGTGSGTGAGTGGINSNFHNQSTNSCDYPTNSHNNNSNNYSTNSISISNYGSSNSLIQDCVGVLPAGQEELTEYIHEADEDQNLDLDLEVELSCVKREGDMLVMKKNIPLVRRKSSGKSKNHLKTLAARMDFRNQKYTEQQSIVNPAHDDDSS